MPFHLPFDDVQWNAAAKRHGQLRAYLRFLRRKYPPCAPDQRVLLSVFREVVQDSGTELLKPRVKIGVQRLNSLSDLAVQRAVEYIAEHQ